MPAHIQQRTHCTVRGAYDDDRLRAQIHDQIIAGARDAADVAGAEPMPQQHALHIALEHGGVGVKIPRESMARAVIVHQCL